MFVYLIWKTRILVAVWIALVPVKTLLTFGSDKIHILDPRLIPTVLVGFLFVKFSDMGHERISGSFRNSLDHSWHPRFLLVQVTGT